MSILKADNITKYYGFGFNKVKALDHFNLEVEEGELVVITGTSGSGKSTALHVMAGLEAPESGTVIIDNKNLYNLFGNDMTKFRRRNIGFIFQFYNLVPTLNVYENIVLPIHLDGRKEDQAFVEELLELLGLVDKKYNYIDELSGGQQQRVAIARALACKPKIIFGDEPTGNLDSHNSKEVIEALKIMQRKYNQTIVLVTHDVSIAQYADKIYTIEDGRIVGE